MCAYACPDKNDDETDEDGEIEKDGQTEKDGKITTDLIEGYVHSVNVDINELTDQNKCIDLQHSFRPIFVQYFKTNLYHRYKAVTYRRVLAEKGYDLKTLEDVWTEKKKVIWPIGRLTDRMVTYPFITSKLFTFLNFFSTLLLRLPFLFQSNSQIGRFDRNNFKIG